VGATTAEASPRGAAHDQAGRLRSSCANRARSSSASPWRLKLRADSRRSHGNCARAMSMARLRRDQGKRDEARKLAPVYGWLDSSI
jgi:hypothetical protein